MKPTEPDLPPPDGEWLEQLEALRQSEERFRLLVSSVQDYSIFMLDPSGHVTTWNLGAERNKGYAASEIIGRHFSVFYPPEDIAGNKPGLALEKARVEGRLVDEGWRLRKDGSRFWASVVITAVRNESGQLLGFAKVTRDLTERMRAEALSNGQRDILERIAHGEPLAETLKALLEFVESQVEGMLGSILFLDQDGVHLRHGAAPSLPLEYTQAIDGVAIGATVGSCGTAAFLRKPVIVEDLATDPLWQDYRAVALPHGLRACWSTPIYDEQQQVLGTFALYYRKPARPSADHLCLIDAVSQMAAIAITRHRAETKLIEKNDFWLPWCVMSRA